MIPIELIMRNPSEEQKECYEQRKIRGELVEIKPMEGGKAQIMRIISTNPKVYLQEDLQPGKIIDYSETEKL